ncbi:MAG TPA: hypothetical protein VGG33_06780, partial [Polyangia bacterium]
VKKEEISWALPVFSKFWKHIKLEYGQFGADPRLYLGIHQGRFVGSHVASHLDASHDFRNTIDFGAASLAQTPANVSHLVARMASLVEHFNNGVRGGPAALIWRGHWASLFELDLYVAAGMDAEAQELHGRLLTTMDAHPRPGTHWYRDWFLPIWQEHGRVKVLAKFFGLLAKHFPKRADVSGRGMAYTRTMNWGEFVHFMSGAAGRDLKPLAAIAFGWPADWEAQLTGAKQEFPGVVY